ncbi:hypothetical protein JXM83_05180 [Candidatus Woesearchaeota archaeon]|nr:hypothetical protein [Candidatus Woesearchaeota archaeon]
MENLESKVISAGLRTSINGEDIPTFPDFTSEIREHKNKVSTLPFVNQKQSFLKLIRALSTKYPYAVLVGDSGVGKSLILDYTLGVLTGEIDFKSVKKEIPESIPLLKDLTKRVEKYQHMEHLMLPNLFDPMRVYIVSYSDSRIGMQDWDVAEQFGMDLGHFLEFYGQNSRDDIRTIMDKSQFSRYIKNAVGQIYTKTYEEAHKMMGAPGVEPSESTKLGSIMLDKILYSFKLSLPEDLQEDLTGTCELATDYQLKLLRSVAGFNELRTNISKEELEHGLAQTLIPQASHKIYSKIINEILHTDITGIDEDKKFSMLRSEFEEYSKNVNELRKKTHQLKTQDDVLRFIRSKEKPYRQKQRISQTTIESVKSQINQFYEEYSSKKCTPAVKDWLRLVKEYFTKQDDYIRSSLEGMLDRIREAEDSVEPLPKPEKKQDPKKRQKDYTYNAVGFKLQHGRHDVDITEILEPHYIEDSNSMQNSWTKVGDMSSEGLFAHFEDYDVDCPPHTLLTELGSFFKSGILVFKDSFSDFITFLTNDENKKTSLKEQFLEYLQTGLMTLVHDGITYQLKAPQIIVGCDNDDPFTSLKGLFPKDEIGLRSRIHTINVDSIADNTLETRIGTIQVLYEAIRQYNLDNKKNISITDDAANILLQQMIPLPGYMSLKYRDFTKSIDDICSYAVSQGTSEVDVTLLKNKTKDEIPTGFFARVNSEKGVGKFFDLPEKSVGYVNGLAVSGVGSSIVKVRSYVVDDECTQFRESAFKLHDSSAQMVDKDTTKGFSLSIDYIMLKLREMGVSKDFLNSYSSVKTFVDDFWSEMSGPSASLAFAVSMMSAITGDEIYKNRFVTGTLNPVTGQVGMIGGTYHKALVPLRLKELSDNNSDMYFLFPAGNLVDFSKDLAIDPFGLAEKVACFPVKTFEQAYHLFTCGNTITENDWQNSQKLGTEKVNDSVSRIKERYKNHCE